MFYSVKECFIYKSSEGTDEAGEAYKKTPAYRRTMMQV